MRKRMLATALLVAMLLTLCAGALAETVGYVTSTGLNIRESASASAKVLRCAKNGDKLIILREQGDWYYVQFNGVVFGYVAKKYVSKQSPTSSGNGGSSAGTTKTTTASSEGLTTIAALGKPPATSREGDRGDDVLKLQKALKILGFYSGGCDGIYGEMTVKAVKSFQKARGMSQDGIAGKVTIKLMFGESAADEVKFKTEKLSWNNGGSNFVPRGAVFTVKDVWTGTTFQVKRWAGYNHIDCEPLTAADTAKMLACYGGAWSWNRRPILIQYNNRVVAASMNGMPHEDDPYTGNNFEGHFCIHLYESKTHGSAQVDAAHQSAVDTAAKFAW